MFISIRNWLKQNPIPGFFVLTFLIAWSIWLPLGIFAPHKVLLTLPGAWAPTLSALILNGLSDGKAGVRQFLRRVIYWRVDLRWYVVVLFSIAIIAYLSIGVGLMLGVPAPEISLPNGLPRNGLLIALPILFLINSFVGGPLAEDIGWRGYILPTLRERMSAFTASLIIGVIWSIWHLPYFIFPEWNAVVGSIPFLWFMLLTTSWSVLLAWVYVNTESILMPVLYHAAINTTLGTLGVLGQDDKALRLIIINTAITWVMAGIVVAMYGFDLKRSRMNV